MDISDSIIPKSDQLNSDDLIAGPRTIRITKVSKGSAEQPVTINFEGDAGHPWKPSKSMRRVLVAMWGPQATAYVGRSVTLYREPTIKFGGQEVGGIRISHASDINGPFKLALTETRGKRTPFTVQPLAAAAPAARKPPAASKTTAESGTITPAEPEITAEDRAAWETLCAPYAAAIKEFLVSIGRITAEQTYKDAPAVTIRNALAAPEKFKDAVGIPPPSSDDSDE